MSLGNVQDIMGEIRRFQNPSGLELSHFEVSLFDPDRGNETISAEVIHCPPIGYNEFFLRKLVEGEGIWKPDETCKPFRLDGAVYKTSEGDYVKISWDEIKSLRDL